MNDSGVLIVSASTGTGHLRAGEALQQALSTGEGSPIRVVHVDLLALAPRWVRAAYGDGYELIATRTPWLWRELYRRTDSASPEQARWGPLMHRTLFREFRALLQSRRWNVCLCTHFLPGQLAAGTPGTPPFAMVVTDLTLHHFWAQPRVRQYFVANTELADGLRPRVAGARVNVTGIPIAPRFANCPTRSEARQALGIRADSRVVLVMGGGLGLGVEAAAGAALAAAVDGLQVIAVCGRNDSARERLLHRPEASGGRLRVLGFVADVERYIAAADLVVTKPGGLTASEVLALGRPLLLTKPIPGQEEGNARYLAQAGAALQAPTMTILRRELERAFTEPMLLDRLSGAAMRHGRPLAAMEIAASVRRDVSLVAAA